uniref:Uncharacterized protein n=1 Tax=Plectus sambesii TaxID=2011161 RepID=A0A914XLI0_9BILA
MQLAKVERDYQSLSIQQDVQKEQTEATVASRVADAVKEIKAAAAANNHPWTTRSHRWANGDVVSESELLQSTNLVAPSVRAIESQTESNVEADNPEAILNSVSGGSLSPTAIAENCDRMMAYINQYGCQLPNDGQAAKVVRAATNTSTDDKNPVLTDKIVQIEAELQRLKSDLNEKDNKIIELSQSLAISESRSDELKKQNLDLNQKGNESEKKLAAVRSELEQITKRQSDTEQMTMGYRRKMEEMEQQLSARSDRIERLEAQLLEAEKNSKNASANGSSSSSASRGHEQFEELAHQQLKVRVGDN